MKNKRIALLSLGLLFLPPAAGGKEPKNELKGLDLTQRYLVLHDVYTEGLNQAGAAGYRFVGGYVGYVWCGENYDFPCDRSQFLMEKDAEGGAPFQYIKLRGTQEELNKTASQGFRLVRRFSWKSSPDEEKNLTCLMEKSPHSDLRYQYLVLSVSKFWGSAKASALLPGIEDAIEKGYEIVQFNDILLGYTVALEKAVNRDSGSLPNIEHASGLAASPRLRLLSTSKVSTLRKELAAAAGYRVVAAGGLELLLERLPASSQSYEYVILTGGADDVLEKEMNEAAAKGFRLHPYGGADLMERRPGATPLYQYRVLHTSMVATMRKELAEAVRQGYEVLLGSGLFIVLQRPRGPGEP